MRQARRPIKDSAVPSSDTIKQTHLVTHAVLIGLTPLIPLPILDDLVKNYFKRRLFRVLAAANGRELTAADLKDLTAERSRGCLLGCVAQAIIYPAKRLFRKIFFFLEWKRAVDLTSYYLHFGYLLDYAMRARPDAPAIADIRTAAEVRAAIDAVCREAPIKPVESAVAGSFRQSRNVLRRAARLLEQSLRRVAGRPDQEQVAQVVEEVEPAEEREVAGLVSKLRQALLDIPEEHFQNLRAQLASRLKLAPDAAGGLKQTPPAG